MSGTPMLKEKHRRAIVAYLKGMSKRDAMTEAGFMAGCKVSHVFNREDVKKEIARRQNSMSTKALVDTKWVVERLKSIANADLNDIIVLDEEGIGRYDLSKMTDDLKRALCSYDTSGTNGTQRMHIKLSDKLRALEMLSRYLGLFDDKLELKGELSLVERLQKGRERAHHGEALHQETD